MDEDEERTITFPHHLRYLVRESILNRDYNIDIRFGQTVHVRPGTIFRQTADGWLPETIVLEGEGSVECEFLCELMNISDWKTYFWGPYHENTLRLFPTFYLRDIDISGKDSDSLTLRSCTAPFDEESDDQTRYVGQELFALLRTFPHAIDGFMGQELLFLLPDGAWHIVPPFVFPK